MENDNYNENATQVPKMIRNIILIIPIILFIGILFVVFVPIKKQEYTYEITNSVIVNEDSHSSQISSDLIDINSTENGIFWLTQTDYFSSPREYMFMIKENENTVYNKTISYKDEIKYVKSNKNRITYIEKKSLLGFNCSIVSITVEYDSSIFKL